MRNSWFDSAMGFVIVLNSVMIAFESTARLNNEDTTVYGLLEHLFLFIYLVELNLRFYAFGWWVCLQSSWVRFDCFMARVTLCTRAIQLIIEIDGVTCSLCSTLYDGMPTHKDIRACSTRVRVVGMQMHVITHAHAY